MATAARPVAVTDWLILGSQAQGGFAVTGCNTSCATDLMNANGGGAQQNAAPVPGATQAGKTWTNVRDGSLIRHTDGGAMINFGQWYGSNTDNKAVYIHTYLVNVTGANSTARLQTWSDDSLFAWVNGTQVVNTCACRGDSCTLDTSGLTNSFAGEALKAVQVSVQEAQDMRRRGVIVQNILEAQEFKSFSLVPGAARAEARLVETWSTSYLRSDTRQCIAKVPAHPVPQTIYLEQGRDGWLITAIRFDEQPTLQPVPCQ